MPGALSAEIAAREGTDYVCVDNQHGLIDHSDTVPMLMAIGVGGSTPIVRAPGTSPPASWLPSTPAPWASSSRW